MANKYYRRPPTAIKAEKELHRLKGIETKTVRVDAKTWIEIPVERDAEETLAQWHKIYEEQEHNLKRNFGK